MRSNLLKQLHDSVGTRKLDLMLTASSGGIEFRTLLLQRVQSEQAEQIHEDIQDLFADLAILLDLLECSKIVLDNHPLRVRLGQAVKVNKQVVPRLLLLVAVLASLEGQE